MTLMDKYCLFLLLSSTGLPSQKIQDLLIQNPTIAENFIILRVKPPHILYELKEITHQDLPMLIFGDNVVFVTLSEKEPIGVLIENKDIARLIKTILKEIWKSI